MKFFFNSSSVTLLKVFYLFFVNINFAQTIVSGKIVDINNEPLPFVHIRIENTNIGTISNDFGLFKLNTSSESINVRIVITAIGYTAKKISLMEGYHIIPLSPDVTKLKEVIVVSRDYGKELIQRAINAIPSNYPREEERHTGFFRETASWNKEENPIYVTEAIIEAIKKPYKKKTQSGDVKLVEFRKYESKQLDSLKTRIYASAHHIHKLDMVARRGAFLGNPDGYKYKIKDTLRQDGKDVYEIFFEKKNKISGYVYVIDSSFAIVKVDVKHHSFPMLPRFENRQFLNHTVTYEHGQDKVWRFKHSHYETAFKKKGRLLNLIGEYVTTEVQNNKVDIPYIEKLQFGDILLDESKEYRSNFWNNYNIILPEENSKELFKSIDYSKKDNYNSQANHLTSILRRFKQDMTLKWTPIDISSYRLVYNNSILDIEQDVVLSKKTSWGLAYSFFYEIKPNFFIGYANESRLSKTGITSHDLVLSRNININPSGRPIFISPGVNLGYQVLDFFIGNYTSTGDFNVKGKSFDSGRTDIFLSQKNLRVMPNIVLSIEKSHRLNFLLSVGYNFQLNEKAGLLFREKDEFVFFGKKAFLENGSETLSIDHEGNLFQNEISISAGISFKY